MDELGIIINQNGEYMTFGTWVPRALREDNNNSHWHDQSFKCELYHTEWFKNLEIPFDDTKWVTSQLDVLAQYGIITILNLKNSDDSKDEIALQIVSPNNITEEQNNTMNNLKEKLTTWIEGNSCIADTIDENNEIVNEFYNIDEYYTYLDEQKNKLHK